MDTIAKDREDDIVLVRCRDTGVSVCDMSRQVQREEPVEKWIREADESA